MVRPLKNTFSSRLESPCHLPHRLLSATNHKETIITGFWSFGFLFSSHSCYPHFDARTHTRLVTVHPPIRTRASPPSFPIVACPFHMRTCMWGVHFLTRSPRTNNALGVALRQERMCLIGLVAFCFNLFFFFLTTDATDERARVGERVCVNFLYAEKKGRAGNGGRGWHR